MTEPTRPPFDPLEILEDLELTFNVTWSSIEIAEILADFIELHATRNTPTKFYIFSLRRALRTAHHTITALREKLADTRS